jgi:hypothetical protein
MRRRRCTRRRLGVLGAILLAALAAPIDGRASLAAGDAAWAERAERLDGRLADPERTEAAIRAYRPACTVPTDGLEACWKTLRALHYLVEFTHATDERKDAAAEEASSLARSWAESLGSETKPSRDLGLLSFWSAIAWGARGQRVGLLTIVREGIAGRMRDFARRAVEIDPTLERGGAYRLLSRLHATLPRVPFVSGWVERDRALPLAEQAVEVDPDDPGNELVLALALLEQGPEERRDEAWQRMRRVADLEPRPALLAEDLAIRAEARERLAEREDGDA